MNNQQFIAAHKHRQMEIRRSKILQLPSGCIVELCGAHAEIRKSENGEKYFVLCGPCAGEGDGDAFTCSQVVEALDAVRDERAKSILVSQ